MANDLFTFLFTDIAGSTRLWERHAAAMPAVVERQEALVGEQVAAHGGSVFKSTGDGVCAVFADAAAAVAAGLDIQRAVAAERWGAIGALQLRVALHTGPAELRQGDYFGLSLSRVARLMAAGHGGQVLLSGATAALVRDHPPPGAGLRDLGAHTLKDLREPERIFQLTAPGLPAQFPPLRSLSPRPTNLPAPVTSFVGREAELADLCERLRRGAVRLVTLTGPGGTGKTRLALEAAAAMRDEFDHGIFLVPLASVRDEAQVLPAVAQALGVRETGGLPLLDALKAHLQARQILLLLENFEHLLEAAPLASELLAAAPGLKVLATSREALRLYGEHVFPVPPLALPDLAARPSAERLAQNPAVTLFVDRANAWRAGQPLAVTPANAATLAEICLRLDGLPLAIELIAAHSDQYAPPELLAQLARRLEALTGGPRDLPQRQRTMRAAVAWSYERLPAEQQALFARAAVFGGAFDAETAAAVTGLRGLDDLAEKSLVQRQPAAAGRPRYALLQVLREYGLEQLAGRGELLPVQQRLARYYLELVERAEPELTGAAQAAWFARLSEEHDNLRAGLGWAFEQGQAEVAVRLCGVLWRFWAGHSHLTEGRRWLEQALAASQGLPPELRVKVLQGAGRLALFQNELAAARARLEEALAIHRTLRDAAGVAWCLNYLSEHWLGQGDYARAEALLVESLAGHRAAGNTAGVVRALNNLGNLARRQGNVRQAEAYLQECLALQAASGSPEGVAIVHNDLGELLRAEGQFEQAASHYEHSLALYRELAYPGGTAAVLHNLGFVAGRQGDHARAAALFRESLALLAGLDETLLAAQCLAGLAGALTGLGRPREAARLFGAAQGVFTATGAELDPVDQAAYTADLARLREQLSLAELEAALAEGQDLPLEQAVDLVLRAEMEAESV